MNDQTNWRQYRLTLLMLSGVLIVGSLIILFFFRTGIYTGALRKTLSILKPFLYGGAIAYLLRPVCSRIQHFLERVLAKLFPGKEIKGLRTVSILLSLFLLFVIIVMLLMAVLPEVISSISRIIRQLPNAVNRFSAWIETLDHGDMSHEVVVQIQQVTDTLTDRLQNYLQTSVLPNLQTFLTNITTSFMDLFSVVKNFGLGCIIASYLLGGWEKFILQAKLLVYGVFPPKAADWIRKEVHFTDRMFSGFINGKLLDSFIIGILCFLFTMITNMPYAMLISIVVGVTNIIPFFGPYLGAIPSALLLLTVSPTKCLIFLVFIIILQQFDGNVLGPAILGDRLGISGFWILFSIMLFSSLWGLVGMIIGVPVFAVLYDIIRSFLSFCLKKRNREDLLTEYKNRYDHETIVQKKPKKKRTLPVLGKRTKQ
ncbi:MAG: AI-2E family transporter [Lachnospiraceae bacterium]|nr:AI-2E family transporter [Lachnospiraceae bacterium]